jgi:uncharacterized protein YjbJ (UPF0337 family)
MARGRGDGLKGRLRVAARALTGDTRLEREGRVGPTAKTKREAEKVIDKIKDGVE